MRVSRTFLYWGTFLVAFGVVMVVANARGVDDALVGDLARLWPVVFIALGAGLLLRRSRWSWVGGMLAAAVPGVVLGSAIVAAPQLVTVCDDPAPAATTHEQGNFAGPASVDLRLRCGDVTVTTSAGDGWQLDAASAHGTPAEIVASPDRLAVTSASDGWLGFHRGPDVWRLTLPTTNAVDVAVEVDAGTGRIDLAGARVGELSLAANAADAHADLTAAIVDRLSAKLNAGAMSIRLPAADDVSGALTVNAGSLRICAPSSLGLRIHSSATLASATYPGLVRSGDTWESPDYATAAHHAELTVAVNLGSLELNPMGGCQ